MATVVTIHRVIEKHGVTEALDSAMVRANFGLEGDWRSRKNRGRQITLIEEEALEFVAQTLKLPAIAPGASRRQVLVRGIRLNETVGQVLRIGPLLVKVEELCDPCKNMERAIAPGAFRAMNNCGGICGRVLEGGTLSVGAEIRLAENSEFEPKLLF